MNRQGYIGASDVPVILGESPFKTPYELWQEKVTGESDFKGNLSTELGHYCEPEVGRRFTKKTGFKVLDPKDAQFSYKHWGVLKVRPDFLVIGKDSEEAYALLECKTAFKEGGAKEWYAGVPNAYYWQVQAQMLATDFPLCHVAALTAGPEFFTYKVFADAEAHRRILEECKAFWHCVQTEKPPAIETLKTAKEFISEDIEIDCLIDRYKDLQVEITLREDELKDVRGQLSEHIKNADGYKHLHRKAIWVHSKPKMAFNAKKAECFMKERLDAEKLAEFYKEKAGFSYVKVSNKLPKKA